MKRVRIVFYIPIIALILGLSLSSSAQLYSPGRDWAGLTQYSTGLVQDSVFVIFSSTITPKKGALKAKFSDGSPSNFIWYKYNDGITNPANRFVQTGIENGLIESNQTNLDKGGYRVSVTRISDNVTVVYTCWLLIDDVVITNIEVDNSCDYLYLNTKLTPSRYLIPDYFTYWDLSKANQPMITKLGTNYSNNLIWHASNALVDFISTPSLSLTISSPTPPLYDSKYDIRIVNPFGRILTKETDLLVAKAPKADFTIFKDDEGSWIAGGANPEGEAPLKLKLESKSINTDSIYWKILNDERLFKKGGDSIVWRDSAILLDRFDAYPTPEKMVPGTYPVQHIALKENSGCRDTMTIYVVVDTSLIKTDAIPNVFSPNGDGMNENFVFKDPKNNISSIKSFHIYIFNRNGLRVYDFTGDPKKWDGWNGTIKGSGGNAPDGVYYYIIEAVGWDNRVYKGGLYKGFLYLFRGK
jgi:gliding motility-associated-like protein